MKCNLVPYEYRRQQAWMRPARWGLLALALIFLVLTVFFQVQLRREKAYYTDFLYPVQEKIRSRNDQLRQGEALVQKAAKGQERHVSWPSLLVSLALSKPEGIVVQKVSGRPGGALIEGVTASPGLPQQWQKYLQQQGVKRAAVVRMQPQHGAGEVPFSLEVMGDEGNAAAS